MLIYSDRFHFSALTLSVVRWEGHPACKSWMLVCWWWRVDYAGCACLI